MALQAHLTVIKACTFAWLFLSYSFMVSRIWMREQITTISSNRWTDRNMQNKKVTLHSARREWDTRRRWRKAEGNYKRCFHVDIFFVNSNKYEYNLGIGTRNIFQSNDIFLFYICFKRNTTGRCNWWCRSFYNLQFFIPITHTERERDKNSFHIEKKTEQMKWNARKYTF